MKEPAIFISYSRIDRRFTRQLATRLRRVYMEVWYDDKLHGGELWWDEILREIRECDVFIYLMSHDSLKSTYCQAELAEAQRLHKLILPVQIRTLHQDIPEMLREIQMVNMTAGLNADTMTELLAALMRLARRIQVEEEMPASPSPIPMPIFVYRTDTTGMKKLAVWIEKLRRIPWQQRLQMVAAMSMVSVLALVILALFFSWDEDTSQATAHVPADENGFSDDSRVDSRGVGQVFVPAGCFAMGSDPAIDFLAQADEQPAREVCFEQGFWIDKTEVTHEQYAVFLAENPYLNQEYWTIEGWKWLLDTHVSAPTDYPEYTDSQQPRVGVNWYEAWAYATWRGGRLCSEAEWEYAARGQDGLLYPWGNGFSADKMVYEANSNGRSQNVGMLSQGESWVGALDMIGNVAEWTVDWYAPYDPTSAVEAPTEKTIRGGSWSTGKIETLRAAYRDGLNPEFRRANVGIRVCSSYK